MDPQVAGTLAAISVTASLPFFLYGAWIMIDTETVTWDILVYHLKFIVTGLALTTVPLVTWMLPRILDQLSGAAIIHAFFGIQAYALLAFALTGIFRIFQAKRQANLYQNPNQDIALEDIHENMGHWRARLRVGVFGYTFLWFCAWVIGLYRYTQLHL
jgi:hypothetical protein